MKLIDVTRQFSTEEKCLDYLEAARWPSGLACVHCGEMGENIVRYTYPETTCKRKRKGVIKIEKVPARRVFSCNACGKQFTPTSGTIFNDSHLPLTKWFMAIALICEAKKGMSAKQLERHLGVAYRTAWYMAHRIREAMQDGSDLLTGVVEADHTYLTPRKPRKGRPYPKNDKREVILGIVERGGKLRLIPVADAKIDITKKELDQHVSPEALLQTDEHATFVIIGNTRAGGHRTINHSYSYGIGTNHTNTVESAFSLLKRGLYGTFHKVSIKHLGRYCNEFSYRFNRRDSQLAMFGMTVKNLVNGEVLPYKKLTEKV